MYAWNAFKTTGGGFKDLNRRAFADKAFNIVKDPKYDGYQRVLAWMAYKYFEKKSSGKGIKNKNISNKELSK